MNQQNTTLLVIQNRAPLGAGGRDVPQLLLAVTFPAEHLRENSSRLTEFMQSYAASDYTIQTERPWLVCESLDDALALIGKLHPPVPLYTPTPLT